MAAYRAIVDDEALRMLSFESHSIAAVNKLIVSSLSSSKVV